MHESFHSLQVLFELLVRGEDIAHNLREILGIGPLTRCVGLGYGFNVCSIHYKSPGGPSFERGWPPIHEVPFF